MYIYIYIYICKFKVYWQEYTVNYYFDTHQNSHLENLFFVAKCRRFAYI